MTILFPSFWGGVRDSMGHEKPFNLTYMAIGNENCGQVMTIVVHIRKFCARAIMRETMRPSTRQ